ncbi:glycogen synthase [Magnetospira sp. QH-2]|uniref:glycogen synthase n=1 Tax=Magnetospira sp. (strain QH-2) TaxID=1288970 RepID=UPI0003E81123|nr:glycogen synthase [Magnetospira sp. QH-2]CCQ73026.1 GT5 : related to glycogen synthase [Magnetospira sp. QH-2]
MTKAPSPRKKAAPKVPVKAKRTAKAAPPPKKKPAPRKKAVPKPKSKPVLDIVMAASECAPIAKVGGLADVVYGLSGALQSQGHNVEIILPKYDCLRTDHIDDLRMEMEELWVPWYEGAIHCSVLAGSVHGRDCLFIEPHSDENFFFRGAFYGFDDEPYRWAFFSKAVLEFLLQSGRRPDVLHVHDWQTALVPVLLYEVYAHNGLDKLRVCLTIHNFKHQGTEDAGILHATGLGRPEYYFDPQRMGDINPAFINFLKGGIVYANFTATVSPNHAWEVRHTDQSFGLGQVLHIHQDRFGGILNGLDYDMWNPAADPLIHCPYDSRDVDGKYGNKKALRQRFLLQESYRPIVAFVGRLDAQKGLPLIRHALYHSLAHGAQFVLLGSSPDPAIQKEFEQLKWQFNDNEDCHMELAFDEEAAHLIYAGADMMVVPSVFEPCGLTQMIALRYGTVPIVRAVGGLADTVFDWDYSDIPQDDRNGYTFHNADLPGIESALNRAIALWNHHPRAFRWMIENGMKQDLSWSGPAGHYVDVYQYIRHK